MTKTLKTIPKISVKIWRPIIKKLDAKLDSACLRRDAYLKRVLEVELDYLDHEVSIPNSLASYNYVAKQLDEFDRKLVSLALPTALTARLNDICARKRIVRDAFFNRLFLLLAASTKAIDTLFFMNVDPEWRTTVWSEPDYRNDGPFFQNGYYPLAPDIDPFWAIRAGLEFYSSDKYPDTVYTRTFKGKVEGGDLTGFNCYLPDWLIPGHQAERDLMSNLVLDEILDRLETPT